MAGWGFSCLVETGHNRILFDTGWNGNILLHNMKIAGVKPEEIDKIFISHAHWDHIGGINHILAYENISEVYLPCSVSVNLKNEIKQYTEVIEISESREICENIWTTGELGNDIKEQSMVIMTDKGNIVLTGCAHPGLKTIIKKSRELGDIHAIVGGFHDSDIDILKDIPLVIPCHCTRKLNEIRQKMPESYENCEVGLKLQIKELI
ncbi:MAG: MBL fold metallo-hydrolase [Methanobacterium sp.]|nr:MBL fold metallo-hydrolase [Methanobacterium sp.]